MHVSIGHVDNVRNTTANSFSIPGHLRARSAGEFPCVLESIIYQDRQKTPSVLPFLVHEPTRDFNAAIEAFQNARGTRVYSPLQFSEFFFGGGI
jgi:hypothetical protein